MQCVWFITEDGESYLRQGKFGLALKRFHAIWKIFDDWTEDQFDFHSFSLRKGQIRSYVEMLRWEDTLRAHPFFTRAALGAVKAYTMLFDKPHLAHSSLSNGHGAEGVDFEGLSTADRKKALKKAKREALKAQERAVEAAARAKEEKAKNAQVANVEDEKKKEDNDPLGSELAQTKEPLEAAVKFLGPLLELSPKRVDVQSAGFEVYFRRRKWLLALKCLRAAKELDLEDPVVHEQIVKFRTAGMPSRVMVGLRLQKLTFVHSVGKLSDEDIKAPSKEVLTAVLEEVIPADTNLETYNAEFLERHKDSAKHVRGGKPPNTFTLFILFLISILTFTALRTRHFLKSEDSPLTSLFDTLSLDNLSLKDAREGQLLLRELKAADEYVKDYNQKAAARFPDAATFKEKVE